MRRIKRVLFVSEAVTLAQIVRLAWLAERVPAERYEVHFASASFPDFVFAGTTFRRWPLHSLAPEVVEVAVEKGRRIHDKRTLRRYLDDDLRVIDAVAPDVIVGDFRPSLAVSAPLRNVPCASLINAYWSPRAVRSQFPLPDHPIVRLLGVERAQPHFQKALPYVFDWFAAPVNALRREHGLAPIGSLQEVLTWGDATLFPDVPALVPLSAKRDTEHYLGPIGWAPRGPLSARATALGRDRPLVYVTLGSSGRRDALPAVLKGVAKLDVDVLVATADRAHVSASANVVVEAFVAGDLAARAASVVVSNGGSSTGWQALREGTPVVGVPFNLDQYLASTSIEDIGAGLTVRAGEASAEAIARAVDRALHDGAMRAAARAIGTEMARWDPVARLLDVLDGLVDARAGVVAAR